MVNLGNFGGEKALAAVFAAGQAFTLRRRLLQRAAQRLAIIERGANANAHVQALGAGRLHGCLRVCTGCGCSNKQSRRRSKAIASCVCGNCGSRTSHHRRIDSSGAGVVDNFTTDFAELFTFQPPGWVKSTTNPSPLAGDEVPSQGGLGNEVPHPQPGALGVGITQNFV